MKRKYRETQRRTDEAVMHAIANGRTSNPELRVILKDCAKHCTMDELMDLFASAELSETKQRLRKEGLIEIVKDNIAVMADSITPDQAEFIDQRRANHIAGELKTRVLFNHKYGRFEAEAEAKQQLMLFMNADETAASKESDFTLELTT
jgi:Glu-tRNA(Gln) amidotransferase subunit E-like FAD-binding protein